jgi:hypothetical protein
MVVSMKVRYKHSSQLAKNCIHFLWSVKPHQLSIGSLSTVQQNAVILTVEKYQNMYSSAETRDMVYLSVK